MALPVRARPVVRSTGDSPAPVAKALTIEEARKRYRMGSLELIVAELKEQDRLDELAKEHANTANRQSTKVKNAMKAFAVETEMEPNDEIQIGSTGYRYDVTHGETISVDKLWKLFTTKKITEKQLLASIKVSKAEADKALGAHVAMKLVETKDGKTLDIRKTDLEVPVSEPRVQRVRVAPKAKLADVNIDRPVDMRLGSNKPLAIKRNIVVRKPV